MRSSSFASSDDVGSAGGGWSLKRTLSEYWYSMRCSVTVDQSDCRTLVTLQQARCGCASHTDGAGAVFKRLTPTALKAAFRPAQRNAGSIHTRLLTHTTFFAKPLGV